MKQNETTKTDWEKKFDKFELGRDETGQQCYFIDGKPIDEVVKSFIRSFLSHQRQEILDQVEKEVIGEVGRLEFEYKVGAVEEDFDGWLKKRLKQKLSALRLEVKAKK